MEILVMAGQLILGLSLLVGLHELGHMVAARMFGMRVEQYFIGFPPKVFSFRKGGTEYGLGAIPLGGYVKISGMIDESLDTESMKAEPQPYEFRAKPAWQRLIVMLGGIIVNVITGIIIFVLLAYANGNNFLANKDAKYGIVAYDLGKQIGLQTGDRIIKANGKEIVSFNDVRSTDVILGENSTYTVERNGKQLDIDLPNDLVNRLVDKYGDPVPFIEAISPFVVDTVPPPAKAGLGDKLKTLFTGKPYQPEVSPAFRAGLKKGDRITAINGKPIRFYHELQQVLEPLKNKPVAVTVQRGSQTLTLNMNTTDKGKVGFIPDLTLPVTHQDYTFGEAIVVGTQRAFGVVFDNIKGFRKIFSGNVPASKAISGPIGIAQMFGSEWIWGRFWALAGLLSMALAFMNALPIPALDGGHATILTYEIISGRKPSDRFLETAQKVGMVILLGLMAFAIFNDVFKVVYRFL